MVGTRVYLGGLSYRVNERDIDRFFKSYSGVGDIEFDDHREAEDAIYEMNGKELLGGRVTVEKAKGTPRNSRYPRSSGGGGGGGGGRMQMQRRPVHQRTRFGLPSRTKYRLSVMNLSSKVSWQDLKDFMRQAGEVTYADAHKHHKNEGVIEFATHSDMRNALIKLDGKDLRGRRIRLCDESGQGSSSSKRSGRSRSRSRSHSRSRSPISRSKSRSPSRSHSRSRTRSRSASNGRARRTHSKSRSPTKSRSRSPQRRLMSRSRSHSQSRSVEKRNNNNNNNNRSRSASRSPIRNGRASDEND